MLQAELCYQIQITANYLGTSWQGGWLEFFGPRFSPCLSNLT